MSTDQAGLTGKTTERGGHYHDGSWYRDSECRCRLAEPPSLLEQVDMEIAALLEPPAWWGDDPFAGIPNAHDEDNEPF